MSNIEAIIFQILTQKMIFKHDKGHSLLISNDRYLYWRQVINLPQH